MDLYTKLNKYTMTYKELAYAVNFHTYQLPPVIRNIPEVFVYSKPLCLIAKHSLFYNILQDLSLQCQTSIRLKFVV